MSEITSPFDRLSNSKPSKRDQSAGNASSLLITIAVCGFCQLDQLLWQPIVSALPETAAIAHSLATRLSVVQYYHHYHGHDDRPHHHYHLHHLAGECGILGKLTNLLVLRARCCLVVL